jgi:hypothetical protein
VQAAKFGAGGCRSVRCGRRKCGGGQGFLSFERRRVGVL